MKIQRLKNSKIKKLINKRAKGIPLAYLTGHKEFYGLDFIVNKHTLIPRPETEQIVSLALDEIKRLNDSKIILFDVGTGSGCIPISIIKTLKRKNIKTFAIDISSKALQVAKKNAKKHNVDIIFMHGNLLSPISKFKIQNSKLLVTANLPYLTEEQFQTEPSIQHEPKSALVAKNNGLALYEELLKQISQFTVHSSQFTVFLEFDPVQSKKLTDLIKKYLPKAKITIHKDLAGLDRIIIIKQKTAI